MTMKKFCSFFIVFLLFLPMNFSGLSKSLIRKILYRQKKSIRSSKQLIIVYSKKKKNLCELVIVEKSKKRLIIKKRFHCSLGERGFSSYYQKREGDLRTPSGVFNLSKAFGYHKTIQSKWPYQQCTKNDVFIDDSRSPDYNRWVTGKPRGYSYEIMRRQDHQYEAGLVIKYNMNPVKKRKGSAIFLHVWISKDIPTVGCIGLSFKNVKTVLRWLKPKKNPKIIMGNLMELINIRYERRKE